MNRMRSELAGASEPRACSIPSRKLAPAANRRTTHRARVLTAFPSSVLSGNHVRKARLTRPPHAFAGGRGMSAVGLDSDSDGLAAGVVLGLDELDLGADRDTRVHVHAGVLLVETEIMFLVVARH